jgi:hypothetical protein
MSVDRFAELMSDWGNLVGLRGILAAHFGKYIGVM